MAASFEEFTETELARQGRADRRVLGQPVLASLLLHLRQRLLAD